MINVTKPFLPPISIYKQYLEDIWERNWLTNNGPLVNELEQRLKDHLSLDHLLFVTNGTVAIQLAIKALGLKGKIITTPFSYVATTSSIVWEGCEPVFVDIDEHTYNIDPNKIEAAIDSNTSGIIATHCFGNACNIDAIEAIAQRHGLKTIYDAAHCFGTKYRGRSVFSYGHVATASFHTTKPFHTVEGGAVVTSDSELLQRMAYMRNFGHDGFYKFNGVGINGKNSEFHAAMGLCNLEFIDQVLLQRKEQAELYDRLLETMNVRNLGIQDGCEFNHAYYPILFDSEAAAIKAQACLEANQIFPRRYFYPSLSALSYVPKNHPTPVSDSIASRILCLPLYHDLTDVDQQTIAEVLMKSLNV